jgi:ribosomal protein L18
VVGWGRGGSRCRRWIAALTPRQCRSAASRRTDRDGVEQLRTWDLDGEAEACIRSAAVARWRGPPGSSAVAEKRGRQRSGVLFHARVASLADGARRGGVALPCRI